MTGDSDAAVRRQVGGGYEAFDGLGRRGRDREHGCSPPLESGEAPSDATDTVVSGRPSELACCKRPYPTRRWRAGDSLRRRTTDGYTEPPMGARCGTGHAFDMTRDGTGGPVVCGIGDGDVGTRVAAFAGGLASALAAPLIAVRVEPPLDSDGSQPALLRGHARLTDALREAQGTAITRTVKLGDPAMALATVAEELRAQMLVVGTNESATLVAASAKRSRCWPAARSSLFRVRERKV